MTDEMIHPDESRDDLPAVNLPPVEASLVEPPRRSLWARLFGRDPGALEARLTELNGAIEMFPDGAANYVLRGEFYLKIGEYTQAAADFRHALVLTETQLERSRWGISEQVLQDRALQGLKQAQKKKD